MTEKSPSTKKNTTKEEPFSIVTIEGHLTILEDNTFIHDRIFDKLNCSNICYTGLIFKNCIISNSDFSYADLERLRLEECQIFNCNFEKAKIKDGFFKNCTFYEKERQVGCSFLLANLGQTEFHHCDISLNNFERSDLFQVTIDNCKAQGCGFNATNFLNIVSRKIVFSSANLTNTDFTYSNFSGVNLKKCNLSGSKFISVILSRVNLEEANLTNTEFSPSHYDGLTIFKADFRNSEIRNINIREIDFSGVQILEWQQYFFMESLKIIVFPNNI